MTEWKCRKEDNMRRKVGVLAIMLLLLSGLCACGSEGKDGDCECVVELKNLPDEFEKLPENIRKNVEISVSIENVVTEKEVQAYLTEENDFKEVLYLNPGTYRVIYVYAFPSALAELELEASEEKFELTRDEEAEVEVAVVNADAFADWAWSMDATREIVQADVFSQTVQFEGQLIELKQIVQYVEFTYDKQIASYDRVTIKNADKGVSITVQNQGEEPAKWTDCEILEMTFRKNNVIFGQGICLGMNVSEIVHEEEGMLGTPDEMTGTVLMGTGYADTNASYINEKSGDKLTLEIESSGDYVSAINYAFEVFE